MGKTFSGSTIGPYKVLQIHEAAYQLLVKGKAVMILFDRLKQARLLDNYEDKDDITENIDKKTQNYPRSERKE